MVLEGAGCIGAACRLIDFLPALCRCTSLQELRVRWTDATGCASDLQFQGAGSTALERRASMQRQLAALSSSTDFLAPESWPTHRCLASCTLHRLVVDTTDAYFRAATRTPSLSRLDISVDDANPCAPLRDLSNLQRVTSLVLATTYARPLGGPVLEAIGQLRSLRQLLIDLEVLCGTNTHTSFAIPASWSALSSLTRLHLDSNRRQGGRLAAAPLSALPAVEHLVLHGAAVVGGVASLFPLTCLTSLVGAFEFAAPDGDDAGGEAGGSGALQAPQHWRDGLRHLEWRDYSRGSLSMLPQLTSLTFLCLGDACISPQLCRCEPQPTPHAHPGAVSRGDEPRRKRPPPRCHSEAGAQAEQQASPLLN
jgi:hypothetical protein